MNKIIEELIEEAKKYYYVNKESKIDVLKRMLRRFDVRQIYALKPKEQSFEDFLGDLAKLF